MLLQLVFVKRNRHKWISSLARIRPLESVTFQKLFEQGHFVLHSTPDPQSTGLLGIPALSSVSPDRSLRRIASHTIEAVETLEQCIYNRKRWQIPAAQMMDVLSDTLCRVLDVCEFIRNGSSQADWQEAANVAFDDLYDVMNRLNTKLELYETVKEELSSLGSGRGEGKKVLELMLRDFEQSGIHLAPHRQERFRQHSQRIQQLTHLFLNPPNTPTPIKPPWSRNDDDQTLGQVLLTCPDEAQRKVAYETRFNEERPEWQILQDLMQEKQELAALLGHASFSDWFLKDKMFRTPDQVGQFLTSLSTLTHEPINEAYNVLGRLKRQLSSSDKTNEFVNPWDRDYLVNQFNRRMIHSDFSASFMELRPYLQPGQILFALSKLYQDLFDIQLEPVPVAESEIWHSDVRKLNVYQLNGSASRTLLGSIYLDLFARNGKPSGAAHYTVRCGRRIWDWEADLCPKLSGWDGIGQREKRQTALVVLSCAAKNREYFTVEEVETLFHEMGHALHSMVSKSDYHHVAGTRCQLDFVEIPSVLAEKFAIHPTLLESSLYHPQTQDLMPKGLFNDYLEKTRQTKEAHTLRLLELHQQLLLSHVDLTFHRASPKQPLLELLGSVEQDPLINPTPTMREKTFPWPMSIAHLGSYGSGYYSYLVARIVSERIWREAFCSKPLAKQHGPRYLKSVLQWGGSRDGWECLSDFFQAPIEGQNLLGGDGSGWMDEWIKNL